MRPRKDLRRSFWHIFPTLTTLAAMQGTASAGPPAPHLAPLAAHRPVTVTGLSQRLTAPAPLPTPLKIAPTKDFGFLRPMPTLQPLAAVAPAPPAAAKNVVTSTAPRATPAVTAFTSDITLDNTLVPVQTVPVSNGTYTIAPNLGKQVGGNLFYSFNTFSVGTGNTANFTGTPAMPVQNVLVRVTGSGASNIDGTLQCTYLSSNLYLLNPNGISFGPNASLNLPGSFAVSTANSIRLGSNGSFNATTPSSSVLTADAPTAFGFTSSTAPAAITFDGTVFLLPSGTTLAVAGGPVQLTNDSQLQPPSGRIAVASVASAGQISIDPATLDLNASSPVPAFAPVSLTVNSFLVTDGGPIHIIASSLALDGFSAIASRTSGAGTGGAITISLTGPLTMTNGSIQAETDGASDSGNITISAGNVVIGGALVFSGVFTQSFGSGNAGSITVSAASLTLQDGAQFNSSSTSVGKAGTITVNVSGAAVMSGVGLGNTPSGITSAAGGGNAGNITLTAGSLNVLDGAEINSATSAAGKGGSINVTVAGAAVLDGQGYTGNVVGITAQSIAPATGSAGDVTLTANSLQILNGAEINSATIGLGKGGNVKVNVTGDALLSGVDPNNAPSGIFANTQSTTQGGDAGSITITAGSLHILAGGEITSSTLGMGNGGSINVMVGGAVVFDTQGYFAHEVGIGATTVAGATGRAGDVTLTANSLQVLNGAEISSATFGAGKGANVVVKVTGDALLSGVDSPDSLTGIFSASASATQGGDAGNTTVTAGSLHVLDGAEIGSFTRGLGKGGNVTVNIAGQAVLSGQDAIALDSGVYAQSQAVLGGASGNIDFTAGTLQVLGGAAISGSTSGQGGGGNVKVTVAGAALISGLDSTQTPSGIFARSNYDGAGGQAGSITFTADSLQLQGGALITSATAGLGAGGSVNVQVTGQAVIQDAGSGIFANSTNTGQGGNAGQVVLSAGTLQISGAGQVGTDTSGLGAGGTVAVNVTGALSLDGSGSTAFTGISSRSLPTGAGGNAGSVNVTAGSIAIANTAAISSATSGQGAAGSVNVTAPSLQLSTAGTLSTSTAGAGKAGDLLINAGALSLSGSSQIQSLSTGTGNAGNVIINATTAISLDSVSSISAAAANATGGDITLTTPSLTLNNASMISATALMAGKITVNSPMISLAGGSVIATDTIQASPNGSDVAIYTASLSLDGSTISAQTTGSGNGGNVQINPATTNGPLAVSLANGALISAATSGSGAGGSVAISADTFNANNSNLSASSTAAGAAGSISINTTGALNLTGGMVTTQAGGNAGGISLTSGSSIQLLNATVEAQTLGTIAGAKGGDISLTANAGMIHLTGGSISATAADLGTGQSVTLSAGSFLAEQNALVSASTTGSGSAGNVTLSISHDATLNTGALLSAGTSSSGAGSNVTVNAGQLTLGGGMISADTSGAGAGGGISFHILGPIVINPGSSITASTSGSGAGGSVTMGGTDVTFNGGNIAASSTGAGPAGSVNVNATGKLSITGGTIGASSMQTDGGAVDLNGASGVLITGGSTVASTAAGNAGGISIASPASIQITDSQIQAQTLGMTANAKGGDITLSGSAIHLAGGSISATAANLGTGGGINLQSGSFLADHGAMVSASNTGSGAAGSVTLTITHDATITSSATLAATAAQNAGGDVNIVAGNISLTRGAGISTKSPGAGGNIDIASRRDLFVNSSTISAEAGSLGNISLDARQFMWIESSTITARTVGKGGQITIDPQYVLLEHSTINGLASGGQDVRVEFAPTVIFIQSGDSQIESNNVVLPPQTDVAAALLALPAALPQMNLGLAPVCAPRLQADFSSFIITGQGGRPPVPGGWTPDLLLQGVQPIVP